MKELKEKSYTKSHVKSILSYVKKQLACVQATTQQITPSFSDQANQQPCTQPYDNSQTVDATLPLLNLLTTAGSDTSAKNHKATRVIKIFDPLIFHGNLAVDKFLYKKQLLKIKNKLKANDSYMLTKFLKILYIQSFVADNALLQISAQIGEKATQSFTTAKKMLDSNEKKEARAAYRLLR